MSMNDFYGMFPNYIVEPCGNVFKNGIKLTPFKSNDYLQVLLYDKEHKRHIFGVHTLVAMVHLDNFFNGCVVHHIDGDKKNNDVKNLKIYSRNEHSREHNKNNTTLVDYVKNNGPANKGKKMPVDFCKKCSDSAKKRGFNGNQFVDKSYNSR